MEYTTNYNLILQGRKPERVSLDSLNGNFTKIDTLLKEQSENHNKDTTIHITAEEREKWDGASEQAVLNRQTLGTECKNFFDIANAKALNPTSAVTVTQTESEITVTSNAVWASVAYALPKLEAGKEYTLSVLISNLVTTAPTNSVRVRIAGATSGNPLIKDIYINANGNYSETFTADSETAYLLLYPNFNAVKYTNTFTASEIMLRDARISDATYVPYRESVEERLTKLEALIATLTTTTEV